MLPGTAARESRVDDRVRGAHVGVWEVLILGHKFLGSVLKRKKWCDDVLADAALNRENPNVKADQSRHQNSR